MSKSAPVKEKDGEAVARRSGQTGGGEAGEEGGRREKDRERVVITAESFCRGIFQNDWAL